MDEEFIPDTTFSVSFKREVFDWIEAAMMAVVSVVLIFTFVARMAGVDGDSMFPTLKDKERLFISRIGLNAEYKDIVVITQPNPRDEPLIKRIIATEGQTIDIDFAKGIVTVDGTVLDETLYIAEETNLEYDVQFPIVVPDGHVFVMGDNRNASWDSRDTRIGMIDTRYILGKVIYRVMPYSRMGVPK